jgi:hypothetical protein
MLHFMMLRRGEWIEAWDPGATGSPGQARESR